MTDTNTANALLEKLKAVGVELLEYTPESNQTEIAQLRADIKFLRLDLSNALCREQALIDQRKLPDPELERIQQHNTHLATLNTQLDLERQALHTKLQELIAAKSIVECKHDALQTQHDEISSRLTMHVQQAADMQVLQYKHDQLHDQLQVQRHRLDALSEKAQTLDTLTLRHDELQHRHDELTSQLVIAHETIRKAEDKELERTHNSSLLGKTLEDKVESFLRLQFGRIAHIDRNVDYHGDFVLTFDSDGDVGSDTCTRIMVECKSKLDPSVSYLRGDRDVDKFMRDMAVSQADYGILFGNFRIPGSVDHVINDTHAIVGHADVQLLGDIILKALARVYAQKQLASALAHLPIQGKPELESFVSSLIDTVALLADKHFDIHTMTLGVKRECKQHATCLQDLARAIVHTNSSLIAHDTSERIAHALSERKRKRE